MKKFIHHLFRFTMVLFLFLAFCMVTNASPLINVPQEPGIWNFIQANWAQIALVISESCALMPGKVKGIVQGILSVIPFFFNKKNN